jgi:hypothetical protein
MEVYESPCIEAVLTEADLERDVLFAGNTGSQQPA